ncbi:MAG: histidine kinase dimerization/phospho-acceptor domain-containing protein [Candidatus Thorarchaeota archaeon]
MTMEGEIGTFIHALSHDLKNILHNIQGYADLLEDDNDPECLEGIVRLVKKAKQLIDNYVTLADAGEFSKRPEIKETQ